MPFHFIWTRVLLTLRLNPGLAGAIFGQAELPAPLKSHLTATALSTYTQGGPAYIKQDTKTSFSHLMTNLRLCFRKGKAPYVDLTNPIHFPLLAPERGERVCMCVCVFVCVCVFLQWLRNPEMNLYKKPLTVFCGWFCTWNWNKLAGRRILSA